LSSSVQVTDNTPLIFKALAWDLYYQTQFPDSPDERPEFNSMSYDKSSAEFKDLQEDNPYNPDVHFAHWAGLAKHVYNVYNVYNV